MQLLVLMDSFHLILVSLPFFHSAGISHLPRMRHTVNLGASV